MQDKKNLTPLEKAERAKKEAEKADKAATGALVFATLNLIVVLIANLDRLVLLMRWLLSCLN